MERETILQAVPSGHELHIAPPYQRKNAAEDLVRAILDALDIEDREPDQWEAENLALAIGYIASRWYFASIAASEKALAPSEERANPEDWKRTDETATKQGLRDGVEFVAGMLAPEA